jgi:hypothetical protein
VRNLAAALSNIDTTRLRHTERLGLIAEAFGWKADAFMHALKNGGAAPQPDAKLGVPVSSWNCDGVLPLRKLGIRRIDQWENVLASASGVVINAGPVGSGRTTVLAASAKFLWENGRPIYNLTDVPKLATIGGNPVIVYGEIRNAEMAGEIFDYAEAGFLVLATMHAGSPDGVLMRLQDLDVPTSSLERLRAVMWQELIRRVAGKHSQALVSDIRVFESNAPASYGVSDNIHGDKNHTKRIVDELLPYVRAEEIEEVEIERVFGPHVRSLVSANLLDFKLIFAGSDVDAPMRRLDEKVFGTSKDQPVASSNEHDGKKIRRTWPF